MERLNQMKTQIEKELAKLGAMLERAEELADSENETTAERYEAVVESIEAAISALEEGLDAFVS